MIVPGNREKVIENIYIAFSEGDFHRKAEVDDPVLSMEERKCIVERWTKNYKTLRYRIYNRILRVLAWILARWESLHVEIEGLEKIRSVTGGAILTSNHFNPADNLFIRLVAMEKGKRLYVVGQETNLAMKGLLGFFMRYGDMLPVTTDPQYMNHTFPGLLKEVLDAGNYVLIYPEQEMWFNYKRPRPGKRGAYYYAALFQVPVISCFAELRENMPAYKNPFQNVGCRLHILSPLFPDRQKTLRESSREMLEEDNTQRRILYQSLFGKDVDAPFCREDIAGWTPGISAEYSIENTFKI